jgi:hypothetical protein
MASMLRRFSVVLAIVVCGSGAGSANRADTQTIARHFTPADRASGRYQYVPFDVPAGTARLRISYSYDRNDGSNVVDLGLFEPGPLDLHTPAFRGYSGGARESILLSATETSPGYRAGPLPAGRWHLLLGLYQVSPKGVQVAVTVEATPGPEGKPQQPASQVNTAAAAGGPRWYAGALHTHTIHSDGALSPVDLIQRVRAAGLEFVAITDHNNTYHGRDLIEARPDATSPLWIVGEEVTTPGGHASVWGLDTAEWVDFRVQPHERKIGTLVDEAHRLGGLFSINHPVADCAGCSWEHEIPPGVDGIEVWNAGYGAQHTALAKWDALLKAGRRITGVGSSDWHRDPNPIDVANVRVRANALTVQGILEGIRLGRVMAMRAATDATPTITVRAGAVRGTIGDTLDMPAGQPVFIDVSAPGLAGGQMDVIANGARLVSAPIGADDTAKVERAMAPGFIRIELFARDETMVAVTNPVFLTRAR